MENPGVMSLWIGDFRTKQSLKEYVEIKFDEVGDRTQSKFMRDFNLDFIDYNQDLLESTLIEDSTTSLTTLLSGSSYETEILSQFVEHYGEELPEIYDSVIRLYDFEYDGDIDEVKFKSGNLIYMGSVVYEEWDE
ncbi:immunity 22 family protein [Bacillus toyonensis]|uniref:immunity 22 family protein n=1 Tax=Bacillus toyonensis TaxID=155322 RepID=UPI0021CFED85|nr:immunity 22 family protein [Bacillus toyonensis]MCU4766522.1 immunity 22 family protein [Bacillus toyonensis]MCU5584660.1 immunity 22 family protein [Bacillus toyonensis]